MAGYNSYAEPVIKWAGGKRQLLPVLRERLDGTECKGTYYEPFVGGGALFLARGPEQAVINDSNPVIAGMYHTLAQLPQSLMEQLDIMAGLYNGKDAEGRKDYYLKVRRRFNGYRKDPRGNVLQTADLIFLNKLCFNGLYRENAKGEFNVPWGKKEKAVLYDARNLLHATDVVLPTRVMCTDFEKAVADAGRGDTVFMDPPYHDTFTGYRGTRFSEEDQCRVAEVFRDLTDRGCRVIATNSDTPFIRELYKGFRIDAVAVKRQINRDADKRTGTDVIIDNEVRQ